MNDKKDVFSAENVDTQIEQFAQGQNMHREPGHFLVHQLYHSYETERRAVTLENARKRLTERMKQTSSATNSTIIDVQTYKKERYKNMSTSYETVPFKPVVGEYRKRPRGRLSRRMVIALVAVLVVGVLSAAALPIISVVNNLLQTTQPLPLSDYQTIHQSKVVNGYTVTIDKVYADANRIIVVPRYTAPNKDDEAYMGTGDGYITTDKGLVLRPEGGTIGGRGTDAQQHTESAIILSYGASSITGNPKDLHLHLVLKDLYLQRDSDGLLPNGKYKPVIEPRTIYKGDITFDFTVPFHPGRSANLHQNVTVNGKTLTLERVVVTRSETRLYVRGLGEAAPDIKLFGETPAYGGSAITKDCLVVPDPTVPKNYNSTCITSIDAGKNYYDKKGEWTFEVADKGSTWTFHFTLPDA